MPGRFQRRHTLRLIDRLRANLDLRERDQPAGDYGQQLIAHFGRPAYRALIRARQRYDAARPQRLRDIHTAYPRKSFRR